MRIYLDHLSLVDLPAIEFVRVAAELGSAGVGLYVSPVSMLAVLPPTARLAIEAPFPAPAGLSLERGRILLKSAARLFATELN